MQTGSCFLKKYLKPLKMGASLQEKNLPSLKAIIFLYKSSPKEKRSKYFNISYFPWKCIYFPSGEVTDQLFYLSLKKGSTLTGKTWFPLFSFRADFFSEGALCVGKQTGSHKNIPFAENGSKIYQAYPALLTPPPLSTYTHTHHTHTHPSSPLKLIILEVW